jgi:chromosome segregation ATPase
MLHRDRAGSVAGAAPGRVAADMEGRRRFPPIGDLGSAAVNPLRVLAEVAADLRSIRKHTISMDREVTGMHASVERIEVQMQELTARITDLDTRMESVESAVIRLEPHIADVNLAMRPLRRVRGRLPTRPQPEEPQVGEDESVTG